jgi:hypothetical protein
MFFSNNARSGLSISIFPRGVFTPSSSAKRGRLPRLRCPPKTRTVSAFESRLETAAAAIFPDKNHPAWGAMVATAAGGHFWGNFSKKRDMSWGFRGYQPAGRALSLKFM